MLINTVRKEEKIYTPNPGDAVIGDVVSMGCGHYLVLGKSDSRNGFCVWLEVKRLPSIHREGGPPFRMMVPKCKKEARF